MRREELTPARAAVEVRLFLYPPVFHPSPSTVVFPKCSNSVWKKQGPSRIDRPRRPDLRRLFLGLAVKLVSVNVDFRSDRGHEVSKVVRAKMGEDPSTEQ